MEKRATFSKVKKKRLFILLSFIPDNLHCKNIYRVNPGDGLTVYPIHFKLLPNTPNLLSSFGHGFTNTSIYSKIFSLDIWTSWIIPGLFIWLSGILIYSIASHWIVKYIHPYWLRQLIFTYLTFIIFYLYEKNNCSLCKSNLICEILTLI